MATRVLVTHQGAVGDGRADDAEAILRAATLAGQRGAALVFPPGVYRLGRTIELAATLTHRVEGVGATLRPAEGMTGPALALDSDTAGALAIRGLVIEGFEVGLHLSRLRDARLEELQGRDCGVAIQIQGGDGVEITRCALADNAVDISLGTGAGGLRNVHLLRNRLDGETPVRFVRDAAAAALAGLIIGPGDQLRGALDIPAWSTSATVLHSSVGAWSDAGASTTNIGVSQVSDRIGGQALPRSRVGAGVSVATALKVATVSLSPPEVDDRYSVFIAPNWATTWYIWTKRTDGFEVRFGTSATSYARFDWNLVR